MKEKGCPQARTAFFNVRTENLKLEEACSFTFFVTLERF